MTNTMTTPNNMGAKVRSVLAEGAPPPAETEACVPPLVCACPLLALLTGVAAADVEWERVSGCKRLRDFTTASDTLRFIGWGFVADLAVGEGGGVCWAGGGLSGVVTPIPPFT